MATDNPEVTDELLVKLQAMPKAPVDDLVVATSVQARRAFLASLIFPLLAAIFFVLSLNPLQERLWRHWMFVMLAIYPTPGLISLLVWLWSWYGATPLKKLGAGWYYVCWQIQADQWQRECERIGGQNRKLGPIIFGVIVFAGMCVAGLAWEDNNRLFAGFAAHFAGITAISALIGLVLGGFLQWLGSLTGRLMRTHTPQVLIGPDGFYITGRYWPFAAPGQWLAAVQFLESEADCLEFTFQIATQHGPRDQQVVVPYPPDKKAEASAVQDLLKQGY